MSWLNDLKRDLRNLGNPVHPRAERRTASGLAARLGLDSASTPTGIKDISTTGIYLFTEKRLPTGELITLILEEIDKPEHSPSSSFPFTLGSPGRERTASGYRLFCLRAWIQTSGECSYGTSSLSPIRIKSRTCSAPSGPSSSCVASVSPRLRKRSFFWAENLIRTALKPSSISRTPRRICLPRSLMPTACAPIPSWWQTSSAKGPGPPMI